MRGVRNSFQTIKRSFSGNPICRLPYTSFVMDPSERYCYNPTLHWNPHVEDYFIKAYGAQHFSRISEALTRPSCYSCIRVNTLKSTSDAVIQKLLEITQESKQQNIQPNMHIVDDAKHNTGQKHKIISNVSCNGRSDDVCNNALPEILDSVNLLETCPQSSHIMKCQIPGLDYVVFVRGSGPHVIEYGYQQGKPPKELLVTRKCAEAVLRGAQVYVPGVLACSAHVEKGDVVAVSVAVEQPGNDGGWTVGITRGTVLQGSETDPHYFERAGLYIGKGTAMLSRVGLFRELSGVAVDMNNRVFSLASFNDVLKGDIFLQNLPSIITAHALDPQQGERILDMCAAPGGKTTAIVSLMKDNGEVIAVDRSHNKVIEIQKLAAELGMNSIKAYKLDALKAVCMSSSGVTMNPFSTNNTADITPPVKHYISVGDEQTGDGKYHSKAEIRKNIRRMKNGPGRNHSIGGRVEKCEGFPPSMFDRVLLDAPCSALGLRPRLFAGEESMESLRKHAKYQKRMFDQAVQLVRPGGVIVYSTCTINPGENEAVVRYALDSYKFLSLALQYPRVGGPGLVGYYESADGYTEEWLRPGEEELVQRFDPSSELDTIGFFIAKFNVGPKDA